MLSDTPNQFKIPIETKEVTKGKFIPVPNFGRRANTSDTSW